MKKNTDNKKESKPSPKSPNPPPPPLPPPVPPPIALLPPRRTSIAPRAALVRHGKGNRGTLQVLPELQSILSRASGASEGSGGGSMHSKMSAGDIPHDGSHEDNHHPINFEGLDIFKLRERSGGKRRKRVSDSDGHGKVMAPKTLVITMDSKFEEKMEAHGNMLRRRMDQTDKEDNAFDIIANQIHDLGELEWMLDEESKMLLRRHVIYWKCALSMPRRKMHTKDTIIPIAATDYLYKPLSKCQRFHRKIACTSHDKGMTEDLLRHDSLKEFDIQSSSLEISPSVTPNTAKGQQRRDHVFDAQAPAYSSYLSNNPTAHK